VLSNRGNSAGSRQRKRASHSTAFPHISHAFDQTPDCTSTACLIWSLATESTPSSSGWTPVRRGSDGVSDCADSRQTNPNRVWPSPRFHSRPATLLRPPFSPFHRSALFLPAAAQSHANDLLVGESVSAAKLLLESASSTRNSLSGGMRFINVYMNTLWRHQV
jgi:hypothetical protein